MAGQRKRDPLKGRPYHIEIDRYGAQRRVYDDTTPQGAIYTQQPPARPNPEPLGPAPIRDGFRHKAVSSAFNSGGGTPNTSLGLSSSQVQHPARQGQPQHGQVFQSQALQGQRYPQTLFDGNVYPVRPQGQGSGTYSLSLAQPNVGSFSSPPNPPGANTTNVSYASAIPIQSAQAHQTKASPVILRSAEGTQVSAAQQRPPAPALGNTLIARAQSRNAVQYSAQRTSNYVPTRAASDHLATSGGNPAGQASSQQQQGIHSYGHQFDLVINATKQLDLNKNAHAPSTAVNNPGFMTQPRQDSKIPRRLSYSTQSSGHSMATKPKDFYKKGRVISVFHIEPASEMSEMAAQARFSQIGSTQYFSPVGVDGLAYHNYRRFIIVRVDLKYNHSHAVPIATYTKRATLKSSIDPSAHAVAYSGAGPPRLEEGERIQKDPIKINLRTPAEKLDPKSRINFRKMQLIDHGWRVKDIGMVDEASLPKLNAYYRQYLDD